jgi:trigger factor
LKVTTEERPNRELQLNIEVEPQELEPAMRAAARRLAGQINVPGFRKGKAPYAVIVNYFGREAVLEEALEGLTRDLYPRALDQAGVEPGAPGTLEDIDLQREPIVLRMLVPLRPVIDPGAYRELRLPYTEPTVTDAMVDEQLEGMREEQAVIEPVERPAQLGDQVRISIAAYERDGGAPAEGEPAEGEPAEGEPAEGEPAEGEAAEGSPAEAASAEGVPAEAATGEAATGEGGTAGDAAHGAEVFANEGLEFVLQEGMRYPLPDFAGYVVGMGAGESRTLTVDIPDDYEEEPLRGKRLLVDLSVDAVKAVNRPALDDDFARGLGEYENLLDLRVRVHEWLRQSLGQRADNEYAEQVLDAIAERAQIEYAPALVEHELDDLAADLERRIERDLRMSLPDYLKVRGQTKEQLREELRPRAEKRLRRGLVLEEIGRREAITVAEDQLREELNHLVTHFGDQAESARSTFEEPAMLEMIARGLRERNTLARLVAIAKGEPVPEPVPEPAAAGAAAEPGAAGEGEMPLGDAEMPAAEMPAAEMPAAEMPTVEMPAAEMPAAETLPAGEGADEPAAERSSAEAGAAGPGADAA